MAGAITDPPARYDQTHRPPAREETRERPRLRPETLGRLWRVYSGEPNALDTPQSHATVVKRLWANDEEVSGGNRDHPRTSQNILAWACKRPPLRSGSNGYKRSGKAHDGDRAKESKLHLTPALPSLVVYPPEDKSIHCVASGLRTRTEWASRRNVTTPRTLRMPTATKAHSTRRAVTYPRERGFRSLPSEDRKQHDGGADLRDPNALRLLSFAKRGSADGRHRPAEALELELLYRLDF
jgi:hypothetical protein